MNRVSALMLRKKLGSILDQVVQKKEPAIVTRGDKPLVAIIPYEDFERREERVERLGQAAARVGELHKKLSRKTRGVDTTAIIRRMREER